MAISANLHKITVTMQVKSGIPGDAAMFDLHYTSPNLPTDGDYDNMMGHIMAFLNTVPTGGGQAINFYLSNVFSTAADKVEVRFYKVPNVPGHLGAPVKVRFGTLSATGSDGLPEEVAACLSFRTDYGTDVEFGPGTRPRARLRNRIYLGPLSGAHILAQDATTKRCFIGAGTIAAWEASAIERLYTNPFADSWLWRVFSRVAWSDYATTFVDMDDAFDTQRRRGPKPTVRVEAPVV